MNLHKLILTENACYKAGKKMVPKGIMVHSTGANNPNLRRYVGPDDGLLGVNPNGNHWNTYYPGGSAVCVHAFIGKLADGSVATYQTLPWDHRGWHAGGKANDSYIGFEICEDGLEDAEYFGRVYREAVELCVYLCKRYNLTEQDILCHCEGASKGIASEHSDVMHWFPRHGKSMDTFRADVKALRSCVAGFVDVTPTAWYADAVKWAADLGVANGVDADHFAPGDPCTRAQAVTMLWRLYGSPEAESYLAFGDVQPTEYYARALQWAVSKGIVQGVGNGQFCPNNPCTRAQIVAMMWRAEGMPKGDWMYAPFEDVDPTAYYCEAVAWAYWADIVRGVGSGQFCPDKPCTRAQMVTFLRRLAER